MDLNEELVYHADILLFGVISAFAIANFPRAYARLSRRSEWSQALRLHYSPVLRKSINPIINQNPPISYPFDYPSSNSDSHSDPSLTACNSLPYRPAWHDPYIEKELPTTPQPGPSPSYPSHHVTSLLRYRVFDNYSFGQLLLILIYLAIMFYISFYESSPFSDPHRTGWVAISQVPFVYALATKNNIIGIMVGVGYEKVCFIIFCFSKPLNPASS